MVDPQLTHLDDSGRARMVDVSEKTATDREAEAQAWVRMQPITFNRLLAGDIPKGDVAAVCRLAGIMAAKRTSDLIPLCHPLSLAGIEMDFAPHPPDRLELRCRVRCLGATGVEMEALTGVSVAALTLYDMLKALDKGMEIGPIRLLRKAGGRSGTWIAPDHSPGSPSA